MQTKYDFPLAGPKQHPYPLPAPKGPPMGNAEYIDGVIAVGADVNGLVSLVGGHDAAHPLIVYLDPDRAITVANALVDCARIARQISIEKN